MRKELTPTHEMVACDVCGRTILKGERTEPYVMPDGARRLVCDLCAPRAQNAGWIRESARAETPAASPHAEPRRSLLGRFRRRRGEGEAPEPDVAGGEVELEEGLEQPVAEHEADAGFEPEPIEPEPPPAPPEPPPAAPEPPPAPAQYEAVEEPLDADAAQPDHDEASGDFDEEALDLEDEPLEREEPLLDREPELQEEHEPAFDAEPALAYEPALEEERALEDELGLQEAQPSVEDVAPPASTWEGAGAEDQLTPAEVRRRARAERRARRQLSDPRHVRAIPTSAEGRVERGLELFNDSEYRRTVAGLVRTLGAPWVSALPLSDSNSEIAVVVAWELSWYQYRVDLSEIAADAVTLVRKGSEIAELEDELRRWNAAADADGALATGATVR